MPVNPKYLAAFAEDETYHVYNRTNNKELLFRSAENYCYFLKQFNRYISPVADTYAWCLLPTHFHLLIKIKNDEEIKNWLNKMSSEKITKSQQDYLLHGDLNKLVLMEFKRFFTSYAMGFNKMYKRNGNLFCRTFKRIKILRDGQFSQALIYIHANAQRHKLVRDFENYEWTSYHDMLSSSSSWLLKNEILLWFGGKDAFIRVHEEMSDHFYHFEDVFEE